MSLPGGSSRGHGPDSGGAGGAMSGARGGILIAVAVVVGILIFTVINRGPSSTPSTSDGVTVLPTTPATNADGTTATTAEGTTDTTKSKKNSKAARDNSQVVVQVLNGSGVQGAATQRSNDLKAKGYQVLPAGNAPATRDGTAVQCVAGYEKEADVLVTTLGELGTPATVEALPDPLPAGFDTTANCYVILGK